jgi:peptide/nickel transport system permease protein
MKRYLVRRLWQTAVTFWIIATLLFFLFRLGLPDPTASTINEGMSPVDRELVRARFGLDLPLWKQYLVYLGNLFRGELGISFFYKVPVGEIIWVRLVNTLVLMVPSIALSYTVGVALGVVLAWRRGTRLERIGVAVGLVARSAPLFWTGMLAIVAFGIGLGWLPTSGMRTLPDNSDENVDGVFIDLSRHMLLPMMVITTYYVGLPMLVMRNTMVELVGEDFIGFCRARGFSEVRTMYRHVARNALLPIVTLATLTTGLAVGGQVVVEVVFSWPGLGREMLDAVRRSDYPVAQATFLLLAALVLVLNLLADLTYKRLDPRVVLSRRRG